MKIIPLINSLMQNMTRSEKVLGEYVINNSEIVVHSTITEFSKTTGVSDSTIVRFSRKLSFDGYHEFRLALAQEISVNNSEIDNVFSGPIDKEDSMEVIAKKFYKVNIEALGNTMSLLDYNEVEKCGEAILKSKKIHFIGIGHSALTAQDAKYKFMRIGMDTDVYTDGHTMTMMASIMGKDDLVFAISHSGNTREIVNALRIAKESGAKTIGISQSINSKMMEYADFVIPYVSGETIFQTGAVSTKIAQFFVVDLIYTDVVRNSFGIAVNKKIKTSKAIESLEK